MRGTNRPRVAAALLACLACLATTSCGGGPPDGSVTKSAAVDRAQRRAYDGAPPVVPHSAFGMTCTECHDRRGREVEGVGFSPPSPHEQTAGLSALSRCRQCHVLRETETLFRSSSFAGLAQDLRPGRRHHAAAPPVLPHPIFMRENCLACHAGTAARDEIRTSHPERLRCRQCHVEQVTEAPPFARGLTDG